MDIPVRIDQAWSETENQITTKYSKRSNTIDKQNYRTGFSKNSKYNVSNNGSVLFKPDFLFSYSFLTPISCSRIPY